MLAFRYLKGYGARKRRARLLLMNLDSSSHSSKQLLVCSYARSDCDEVTVFSEASEYVFSRDRIKSFELRSFLEFS